MFYNETYDDCGTCCSWLDDEESLLAPDVEFRHGNWLKPRGDDEAYPDVTVVTYDIESVVFDFNVILMERELEELFEERRNDTAANMYKMVDGYEECRSRPLVFCVEWAPHLGYWFQTDVYKLPDSAKGVYCGKWGNCVWISARTRSVDVEEMLVVNRGTLTVFDSILM
jgi:hypothetical protein